ncbi:NAD(P)H-binding protein [Actinocorallia sp. API 0066]|uniref:NmrA family NAD(P)-binding protein n=1 Tax=Actinocorallia sp. API 0066 TaxID=2896846 RepID=UPI001E4A27EE|nr:NAD(P)H-binding protein [Actinocorallia sp. API 0066]MCD0453345.1 NAD(P)H-binding protein [Actinocorallia sp. API 0066]
MKIAIIGGTGTVGTPLLSWLIQAGAHVTALARTSEAARRVRAAGGTPVPGDLDDGETIGRLIADADSVLLLTANTPDQLDQEIRVIDVNASSRRAPIVKVSVPAASADSPLAIARTHHAAEEHLRGSGVDHAIVRPGWFMQNLDLVRERARRTGVVALPIGDGAIAAVDARDIAHVCGVLLTDPSRFAGRDVHVVGRQDVTGESMAAALSRATDREISFRDISRQEFETALGEQGHKEDLVEDLGFLYDVVIRNGFLAGPNESVHELTGRPALTFPTFAEQHAEWFA